MRRDEISTRQLMVLVITALLMPATALLPTMTTRLAGGLGWLSVVGAIPFLLGAVWAAEGICRVEWKCVGVILRNTIIIMYAAWTFLLLMLCVRLSGARLEEIYGRTAAIVCVSAMLLLAVWMALGKISAFARAGEIFYLALAVLLVGVLLLAAFEVEITNFSVKREELYALPKSCVAVAGLLLNVYPTTVLMCKVQPQKKNAYRKTKWVIAFSIALTLLIGAVIGCLGPKLAGTISSPFLIMVQGLGVRGAFQRVEALIIAVWTLSDLALTGLLLHTWRTLASFVCPEKWSKRSVIPVAVIGIVSGWVVFLDLEKLWAFSSKVLPVIGILLGFVCPVFARSLLVIRKKAKRR